MLMTMLKTMLTSRNANGNAKDIAIRNAEGNAKRNKQNKQNKHNTENEQN